MHESLYFKWIQISNAIPVQWKESILEDRGRSRNLCHFGQYIIFVSRLIPIENLCSKEIYKIIINNRKHKPTSQHYFSKIFPNITIDWKKVYLLPMLTTRDSFSRIFQYKILNNILFLNKKLFLFGKVESPLCSFCHLEEETPLHIFFYCQFSKTLWVNLVSKYDTLNWPIMTPQSAVLGFVDSNNEEIILTNHLLLIYKIFIFQSRVKGTLFSQLLFKRIASIKFFEETVSQYNENMKNALKMATN